MVVLVHGSMDRSGGMVRAARRLDDRYRVLRYDRRGYGRSQAAGPPFTMHRHVADLVALLRGRQAAAVVGHSYGGNVALALADLHPGLVRAVGTYESPMSWEPWWPVGTAGGTAVAAVRGGANAGDAAERFLRRMLGDAVWERLPERTRAERRAEGAALVGELDDLRRAAPWNPANIRCPVVCGFGELSQEHHREGARALGERLGAEVIEFPGARHGIHLAQPDAFAGFAERTVQVGSTPR